MKKIIVFCVLAVLVVALPACSGTNAHNASDSTGNASDTTTAKMAASESPNAGDINNMADTAFVNKAAAGGKAEVVLGSIAMSKGTSQAVKSFCHMMVMDHGKANAELMKIIQSKSLHIPVGSDAAQQAKSDSLSQLRGKTFDQAYVQAMVEGHEKMLALMKEEASNGKDADIRSFAAKTAPVVERHLEEIKKIQSAMK